MNLRSSCFSFPSIETKACSILTSFLGHYFVSSTGTLYPLNSNCPLLSSPPHSLWKPPIYRSLKYLCVCVPTPTCYSMYVEVTGKCWGQFSPSTFMWVLGINLRSFIMTVQQAPFLTEPSYLALFIHL